MVLSREGAPPGTPEHDFVYEHDMIVACHRCEALRLETWRHDCFDFESSFDRHWYFPVEDSDADTLRERTAACPDPLDPGCDCRTHRSLRRSLDDLPPRKLDADRTEGVREPVRVRRGLLPPGVRLEPAG